MARYVNVPPVLRVRLPDAAFAEAVRAATAVPVPDLTEAIRAATAIPIPDLTEAIREAFRHAGISDQDLRDQWVQFDLSALLEPDARRPLQATVALLVFVLTFLWVTENYELAAALSTLLGPNPLVAAQFAWWLTGQMHKRLTSDT